MRSGEGRGTGVISVGGSTPGGKKQGGRAASDRGSSESGDGEWRDSQSPQICSMPSSRHERECCGTAHGPGRQVNERSWCFGVKKKSCRHGPRVTLPCRDPAQSRRRGLTGVITARTDNCCCRRGPAWEKGGGIQDGRRARVQCRSIRVGSSPRTPGRPPPTPCLSSGWRSHQLRIGMVVVAHSLRRLVSRAILLLRPIVPCNCSSGRRLRCWPQLSHCMPHRISISCLAVVAAVWPQKHHGWGGPAEALR